HKAWRKRSLVGKSYVYLWADGVHFNVRLEDDRLACLVLIGVRPDGVKEVIALEDGYRLSPGPLSYASLSAVVCPHQSWLSPTAPWASGPPCVTSIQKQKNSVAGYISWPTCWISYPSACSRAPNPT